MSRPLYIAFSSPAISVRTRLSLGGADLTHVEAATALLSSHVLLREDSVQSLGERCKAHAGGEKAGEGGTPKMAGLGLGLGLGYGGGRGSPVGSEDTSSSGSSSDSDASASHTEGEDADGGRRKSKIPFDSAWLPAPAPVFEQGPQVSFPISPRTPDELAVVAAASELEEQVKLKRLASLENFIAPSPLPASSPLFANPRPFDSSPAGGPEERSCFSPPSPASSSSAQSSRSSIYYTASPSASRTSSSASSSPSLPLDGAALASFYAAGRADESFACAGLSLPRPIPSAYDLALRSGSEPSPLVRLSRSAERLRQQQQQQTTPAPAVADADDVPSELSYLLPLLRLAPSPPPPASPALPASPVLPTSPLPIHAAFASSAAGSAPKQRPSVLDRPRPVTSSNAFSFASARRDSERSLSALAAGAGAGGRRRSSAALLKQQSQPQAQKETRREREKTHLARASTSSAPDVTPSTFSALPGAYPRPRPSSDPSPASTVRLVSPLSSCPPRPPRCPIPLRKSSLTQAEMELEVERMLNAQTEDEVLYRLGRIFARDNEKEDWRGWTC